MSHIQRIWRVSPTDPWSHLATQNPSPCVKYSRTKSIYFREMLNPVQPVKLLASEDRVVHSHAKDDLFGIDYADYFSRQSTARANRFAFEPASNVQEGAQRTELIWTLPDLQRWWMRSGNVARWNSAMRKRDLPPLRNARLPEINWSDLYEHQIH